MTGGAKRGIQVVPVGPTPLGGADPPPGARAGGVEALAHQGQAPFAYYYPRTPKTESIVHGKLRHLHGAETREREKLSGR